MKLQPKHLINQLIITLLMFYTITNVTAQTTSIEQVNKQAQQIARFIEMDLAVKQATLDGVKERVILLHLHATPVDDLAHDASIQKEVNDIYRKYGMSSSQAIYWATRYHQAIKRWLADNPSQQQRFEAMAAEIQKLSVQLEQAAK